MAKALTSPLYITGITPEGKFLLGGIFRMQDEVGFPLDSSFEECRQNGYAVDWLEALCDCWLNGCLKFDSFARNAELLTNQPVIEQFKFEGAKLLSKFPEMKLEPNPIDAVCRHILNQKRQPNPRNA